MYTVYANCRTRQFKLNSITSTVGTSIVSQLTDELIIVKQHAFDVLIIIIVTWILTSVEMGGTPAAGRAPLCKHSYNENAVSTLSVGSSDSAGDVSDTLLDQQPTALICRGEEDEVTSTDSILHPTVASLPSSSFSSELILT